MRIGMPLLFLISVVSICALVQVAAVENPCAASVVSRAFWIPQFGHGSDLASGNRFSSLVRLINLQETVSRATIVTCSDSGEPLAMLYPGDAGTGVKAVSSREVELAGKGTISVPSANLFTDKLTLGYALVETSNALGVEVLFDIRDDDGFLTSTNVRVGTLVTSSDFSPGASMFADLRTGVNTGIALLSPRDRDDPVPDVLVDLIFFDADGELQGKGQQLLREGQKVARFASEFLKQPLGHESSEELPSFNGSVEIRLSGDPCNPLESEAPCPIAVLPLRQEGLVLTTQGVLPGRLAVATPTDAPVIEPSLDVAQLNLCRETALKGSYRVFWIPQFGHGTDPSGNQFDVSVKLLNLESEEVEEGVFEAREAAFEIVSCGADGQPLKMLAKPSALRQAQAVSDLTLPIPPNGTREVASLNEHPDSQLTLGYSIVRSLDFVAIEVLLNIRSPNGFLTSTNIPTYPIITATSFFADIDTVTPINTGIALFFPPEFESELIQKAEVELFLLDDQGKTVGEHVLELARGHWTARFIHELFDVAWIQGQPFSGSLEIRSSSRLAVLPLRQEGLVLTTQNLFPPRVVRR